MVFYFFLLLLFLSDVFIFERLPNLNFYITLFFPILLYLGSVIKNKKISLPKISIFYLLFLVFSGVSVMLAIDKQTAFESLLVYISAFLIFIFSFNYQQEIKKYFSKFIIFLCLLATVLFIVNGFFHLSWFSNGGSLFYTGYFHNELGNLLVLGLIIGLQNNNWLSLLLFPAFLLSYSRTGYLSLILVSLFNRSIFKKTTFFLLLFFTLMFFLITAKETRKIFPTKLSEAIEKKLNIPQEKSFLADRPRHFSYAASSIKELPWFGVGPGNFLFAASKRQVNWAENTTTAHNIFLDILAENGILAGIFFIIYFIFLLIKSKKDTHFYLFISLTLIFMFDFAYRFNFFLIIWFVLAGLLVKEEKNLVELDNILLSLAVLIIFQIYFFSQTFIKNIAYSTKNYVLNGKLGDYYECKGEKSLAVEYYKREFLGSPMTRSSRLEKILQLLINLYGEKQGKEKFTEFLREVKKTVNPPVNCDLMKIIKEFCYDYKLKC